MNSLSHSTCTSSSSVSRATLVGFRRRTCRVSLSAFAALGFAGASPVKAECPIPAATQPYVAEIVTKLIFDTSFIAANVHDRDRAFALSLFGVGEGRLGQLLLAKQCTPPKAFRPTYDKSEDGKTITRSQVVCDGAGVDVVKIAIASGRRAAAAAFRLLRYDATRFSGKVRYEPYPAAAWRSVPQLAGAFTINSEVFRRVSFTPTDGEPIDLTHVGSLSAGVKDNAPNWAMVHVVFPAVASTGQPVIAEVRVDEHGEASGDIRAEEQVLATVSGTGFEPVIAWQGECAGTPALSAR